MVEFSLGQQKIKFKGNTKFTIAMKPSGVEVCVNEMSSSEDETESRATVAEAGADAAVPFPNQDM